MISSFHRFDTLAGVPVASVNGKEALAALDISLRKLHPHFGVATLKYRFMRNVGITDSRGFDFPFMVSSFFFYSSWVGDDLEMSVRCPKRISPLPPFPLICFSFYISTLAQVLFWATTDPDVIADAPMILPSPIIAPASSSKT